MKQNPRVITRRYLQQLSFAQVLQLVLSFETPRRRQSASPHLSTGFYTGVRLKLIKETSVNPEPV